VTTVQFYRRSLALPPIVFGLPLVLRDGVGVVLLGCVPYGIVALWLVRYSKNHPLPALESALRWAPIVFAAMVALLTSVLFGRSGTEDVRASWMFISTAACAYAVVLGYLSVGCVFLIGHILRLLRVIEDVRS
jgi:hypothetical protein